MGEEPHGLVQPTEIELESVFSTDRRFLMITRANIHKMTPTLQEPNVTPRPMQQSLQLFDLNN